MGWFSKNKYESHPDILDRIGKRGAEIALSQIQTDFEYIKEPRTYCEVTYRTLKFNDKPLETHWGSLARVQELEFAEFNMEGIPHDDENLFLRAIAPYLQKHLEENLKKFFPRARCVTAVKTTYVYYKDTINAIQIDVVGISTPASKNTLNKW